jgi:hypothetical protein
MIGSSQICFKLYENKDFLTKQNDQAVPPYTKKLLIKWTEKFSLFLTTVFCPLHPALLRDLGVKLVNP